MSRFVILTDPQPLPLKVKRIERSNTSRIQTGRNITKTCLIIK